MRSVNDETIAMWRKEMLRLMAVQMSKTKQFLDREAYLIKRYGHDLGALQTAMRDDVLLNNASGASKTCATLATGLASAIQAELALRAASGDGWIKVE